MVRAERRVQELSDGESEIPFWVPVTGGLPGLVTCVLCVYLSLFLHTFILGLDYN